MGSSWLFTHLFFFGILFNNSFGVITLPVGKLIYVGNFTYQPVLRIIAGMDFLGSGYDANFRDQFFTTKITPLKFSYNDNPNHKEKPYRYPSSTTSDIFAVPDQVFVRTIGKTNSETYIFQNSREQRQAFDIGLGIEASDGQVSASLNLGIGIVLDSSTSQRIITNSATTALYQLYLGNPILSDDFSSMASQMRYTYLADPNTYLTIVKKYGTHFVDCVVMGGLVKMDTTVTASSDSDALKLALAITANFQAAGGGSGSLALDFQFQTQSTYYQTSTTSSTEVYGGDPRYGDFLSRQDPTETTATEVYDSWKSTLVQGPAAIKYRLSPIWQLILDPVQQKELCNAVGTYLGFLPNNKTWCDTANQYLAGTVSNDVPIPST